MNWNWKECPQCVVEDCPTRPFMGRRVEVIEVLAKDPITGAFKARVRLDRPLAFGGAICPAGGIIKIEDAVLRPLILSKTRK